MQSTMKEWVLVAVLLVSIGGCSAVGRVAVDKLSDGLSSGGSVFSSDEDPDLVLAAIPFGLKTYESLLAVSPKHRGLLLATAGGFCAYGFLLQQQHLDIRADYTTRRRLDERVGALYLRARDYALRGLAIERSDFAAALERDPGGTLAEIRKTDVAFLYWAGIAWAAAISVTKSDPERLAELPLAAALMTRALALDEGFDAGAIHEFFVTYEGSRPGGDPAAARTHYRRADELSGGNRASLHLALAEGLSVQQQDLVEFRSLVQRAIAVDPNSAPEWRVANTLARRRAIWLDGHVSDLFIHVEEN